MGAHKTDSIQNTSRPSPAPAPHFTLHDDGKGIDIKQWSVRNSEAAIVTTAVEEQMAEQLNIKLPGMLFANNSLELIFSPTSSQQLENTSVDSIPPFKLSFTARGALRMVGLADPNIRVRAAACWEGKNERSDVEISTIEEASDWTFSTKYPGTIENIAYTSPSNDTSASEKSTGNRPLVPIDYDALRNTELPIVFSSQVILFEDELDDNGTASYKVRIRVMPSFFFILARFFLRVDGVLLRVYDTRYYHRFGSDVLVRETSTKEAKLDDSWKGVHPSILRDPDLVSRRIPSQSSKLENILLPS